VEQSHARDIGFLSNVLPRLLCRYTLRLLVVNADAEAGTGLEGLRAFDYLLGFNIEPLTNFTGAILLQRSFFRDVSGDDDFRSIGEQERRKIAGVARNPHLI